MDSRRDVDAYGGVAGRILREAMSLETLLTGVTLLLVLGVLGYILFRFEANNGFSLLAQLGTTLVLVRFALNGFAREWSGTVFSNRGGPWSEVAVVSVRFLALTCIWMVPVYLLGWRPDQSGEALGTAVLGMGGGKALSLTTLAVTLFALTPPVFLIVSVSAQQFSDLWNRDHWEFLFRGRTADLLLIYVVYLGALFLVTVLFLPFFFVVMTLNQDLATLLAFGALGFGLGLSVTLLGRLCGFFAATFRGLGDWTRQVGEGSPPREDRGYDSDPGIPARPPANADAPSSAISSMPVSSGAQGTPSGRTPLLDARERLDELERRYETEPQGALQTLEELREGYAPHPLILHALCVLYFRTGRQSASLEVAREALPLCLERGTLKLAAEIFALHLPHSDEFHLHRDSALVLADTLRKWESLAAAEEAYVQILDADPGERRAIKGLLQVAESHLHDSAPERAQRIYLLLLEKSGSSPLALHMRQGLEEAKRRIHRAA